MDWSHLDILQKMAQTTVYVIGASWVYLNQIRGRAFVPRLDSEVSGKLFSDRETQYLLVNMQVKNVGSCLARIGQKGTGLIVTALRAEAEVSVAKSLKSEEITAFPVLVAYGRKKARQLEPGTVIHEQKLIVVPRAKYRAFNLELKIDVSGGTWWDALRGIGMVLFKSSRKWGAVAVAVSDDASQQANELVNPGKEASDGLRHLRAQPGL